MNYELPKKVEEPYVLQLFWVACKIAITLASAFTVQHINYVQTGYYIPTTNVIVVAMMIVLAVKMWSK